MKKTIAKLLLPLIFLTALVTPVQAAGYTLTLYADQDTVVGTVQITTYATYLTVTYNTIGGWELLETHLYVGTDEPAKHSPGKFDYKHESIGDTTDTYTIPYSDFEPPPIGATLYIAAHAVVGKWDGCIWQEETGWGWTSGGCGITNFEFDRGWGWYSLIYL